MMNRLNGPWLIESSPNYPKRRLCVFLHHMALLPITILGASIRGYRDELLHMSDTKPTIWDDTQ